MPIAKLILVGLLTNPLDAGITVDTSNIDIEEAYCLAQNVYYESRDQSLKGQYAVASVTLNRMKDYRFPKTVCKVVKQSVLIKSTNRYACAFSWFCFNRREEKDILYHNKDSDAGKEFRVAAIVAINTLGGNVEDYSHGATYFHEYTTSSPTWRNELIKTVRIGTHDFYKAYNRGSKT